MRIRVIFLGTTVAEHSTKYGFTICSAGWSPTLHAFVRLYPIPWPLSPSFRAGRWEDYELSVRRNDQDNRRESWKIDWEQPVEFVQKWEKADVLTLIKPYIAQSIAGLNDVRNSLGLLSLSPTWLQLEAKTNESLDAYQPMQVSLYEDMKIPIQRQQFLRWPYLAFQDKRGFHSLPLLDRGTYHLLNKTKVGSGEQINVEDLRRPLQIGKPDISHLLLIGNMSHQRSIWLVITCITTPYENFPLLDGQLSLLESGAFL